MIRIFNALVLLAISFPVLAQVSDSLNTQPGPVGDLEALALPYYRIDFTDEQRKTLAVVRLELIFRVDEDGNAKLEEVNGVENKAILDSLYGNKRPLPRFIPRRVNGQAEPALFFMLMQFPTYQPSQRLIFERRYRNPSLSDLEYYKIGSRLDMVIGGMVNSFGGNASDYLGIGGGMKVDLVVSGKSGWGFGLVMDFYGNPLKKKYPIDPLRAQNEAPPTLLLGGAASKPLSRREKHEVALQIELTYALQNIAPATTSNGSDHIGVKGFSPGLVTNYLLRLGRLRVTNYHGEPALLGHYANLHVAFRPMIYDLKQASGFMAEVGLSYRIRVNILSEFKLKE